MHTPEQASNMSSMWSARYQLLPFSLARLSEPSTPAFTRALICVFFPALACAHGLQATLAPEGVGCSASHWAAADASLPEATAEAVCTMLSTALADSDEARQQLCHERFFEIAIENEGIAAASKHLNVVRALNKSNHEEMLEQAKKTGRAPDRKAPKKVSEKDKLAAERLRDESVGAKRCFSLGLLDRCSLDGEEPNVLLLHLLRIALSNHGSNSTGLINWGQKCDCEEGSDAHKATCWWSVHSVYFFLEQEFFHLFIHQMWVEGAFNRLSHNHDNSSAELMEAKLEARMNGTCEVMVPTHEINARLREIEEAKKCAAKDISKRTGDIRDHFMQKPSKQRVVGQEKEEQQAAAATEQAKKDEAKKQRLAKAAAEQAKKDGEEQQRLATAAEKAKTTTTTVADKAKKATTTAANKAKKGEKRKPPAAAAMPKKKQKDPEEATKPAKERVALLPGEAWCNCCAAAVMETELDREKVCKDQAACSEHVGKRGKRKRAPVVRP